NCAGEINIPNKNKITISSFINGYIKHIYIEEGQIVRIGSLIATIQDADIIKLQEKYLAAKYYIDLYEKDYKRQGELTVENAVSIKKMDKSKAKYFTKLSELKSLEKQLKLIGINTEKIDENNFTSEINIYSPVNGIIKNVTANKGSFIADNLSICEVVNNSTKFLKLETSFTNFNKIKIRQDIEFYLDDKKSKKYNTKVNRIYSSENNTLIIRSEYFKNKNLYNHMPVKAKIITGTKLCNIVPKRFVKTINNKNYLLIKKNNKKVKTEINIVNTIRDNITFTITENNYSYPLTIYSQN
ncbi:MAG: efflux RND transporter periplasmic adaptor subunit, partial [Bacteroidota bacterium]|nr:efflux RND transporter periplasmic adaptor subunit [Bacteroidota bacterium]